LAQLFIALIEFFVADHVFEAMMYIDDSVYYNKPNSVIDNLQVIQEIVKKSGMTSRTVSPPDRTDSESINKDVVKRLVS
jgi:hypothetical protein